MTTTVQALNRALSHHQAGDLKQARDLYCQVLEKDPHLADAWHLLGLLSYQIGEYPLAAQLIRNALAQNGSQADYHNSLGTVLRAQGKPAEAVASYERALQLRPALADAHNNLGVVQLEQKRARDAAASFRRAIAVQPGHALALMNLGNALQELDDAESAVACYQQVLQIAPEHAETLNNLGRAYTHLGRLDEAAAAYCRALELRPDQVETLCNLGGVLHHLGKMSEAIDCHRAALQVRPDLPAAHNNLGNVLRDQGQASDAIECYRTALRLKPDHALAHNNLGVALTMQGKLADAQVCYRRALELDPTYTEAHSNLLFALNYDATVSPEALFAEHCAWGRAVEERAPPPQPHANERSPDRPLQVGYVSPDLRDHALIRFFEPVLAHHDPERIEVHCYAEVPVPDAVTARLRGYARGWRSTCGLSDVRLAEQIRADKIDILVDLAGHTARNRLRAFAHRPAPVQVAYLGYPNTTGLRSVDYLVTDEVFHPPDGPVLTTEEPVRLPCGLCCFTPPAHAPAVGPSPVKSTGRVTFGSLHNPSKLNEQVVALWCRVLQAVPDARLLLFRDSLTGELREQVRRRFLDAGATESRLEFRHQAPADGYLGVYNDIDISLDVFPWGGGTTTYESLWMGVPTLSLVGQRYAERGSASVLTRLGLADWVAASPDDYVARAQRLAADHERLATLRGSLRTTMMATVCDGVTFTRCLEDAYRMMWRRWLRQA